MYRGPSARKIRLPKGPCCVITDMASRQGCAWFAEAGHTVSMRCCHNSPAVHLLADVKLRALRYFSSSITASLARLMVLRKIGTKLCVGQAFCSANGTQRCPTSALRTLTIAAMMLKSAKRTLLHVQ